METLGIALMITLVALGIVQIAFCAVASTGVARRADRLVIGPRRRLRNLGMATFWGGVVVGCLNGLLSDPDSPVFVILSVCSLTVAVIGLLLAAAW